MIAQVIKPSCTDAEFDDSPFFMTDPVKVESRGKVFVQGAFANTATGRLFASRGFEVVYTIDEADIVVWTGGEDINPELYNEKPGGAVGWSTRRDNDDLKALERSKGKFLVGICRGAQLLNVTPNGGTLWQDVDHHVGDHYVTDKQTGKVFRINSLHHQQLRLTSKAELLSFTDIATVKHAEKDKWHCDEGQSDLDVEAAWYPETRSLCIQWHPEFSHAGEDSYDYFHMLLSRYYTKEAA